MYISDPIKPTKFRSNQSDMALFIDHFRYIRTKDIAKTFFKYQRIGICLPTIHFELQSVNECVSVFHKSAGAELLPITMAYIFCAASAMVL